MKLKLLFLFLFTYCVSPAQNLKIDSNTKNEATTLPCYLLDTVVYSSYTKSQLYSNALSFIANSFEDSRAVIESKDLEIGEILFTGNTFKDLPVKHDGEKKEMIYKFKLFFKCKLYFKDNKFKVILSSLEYPVSEVFNLRTRFPIQPPNKEPRLNNIAALDLAYKLIAEISQKINQKPNNDF